MPLKKINIIQLGFGNVGRVLVKMLSKIKKSDSLSGTSLKLKFVFNSQGGFRLDNEGKRGPIIFNHPAESINLLEKNKQEKTLIVDVSNSDKTSEFLLSQMEKGIFLVLSNKKPLCTNLNKGRFDLYRDNVFYETTVGAGLPVIYTLKSLLKTSDEIFEIKGALSGTLGFIMSQLENGVAFSSAVKKAKSLGFTETDPREDLKGTDVARKILILARTMGRKINLRIIKVQSLYPKSMDKLSLDDFLNKSVELDGYYSDLFEKAAKYGKTFRFIGSINNNRVEACLKEVEKMSDFGGLKGPDNLVVFRTKRYNNRPLVIKGPGAGAEVTAAGVLNDMLSAAKLFCLH